MAKQKSLKKTIKNNKKKKLSLKNIDFKKNWKKLTYGGALALLLFMSVSYAGYAYLEQRNLEAQAYRWTYVGSRNGVSVRACKKSQVRGNTYRISLSNGTAVSAYANPNPVSGGTLVPRYSTRTITIWSGKYVTDFYINRGLAGRINSSFTRWC